MKKLYLCLVLLFTIFLPSRNVKIAPSAEAKVSPTDSLPVAVQTPPEGVWGLKTTLILPTDRQELDDLVNQSEYPAIFTKLIGCESQWQNIARMDSNHQFSYGILQFQKGTWEQFAPLAHVSSTPMNPQGALEVASYMISHGELDRWSCAKITNLI